MEAAVFLQATKPQPETRSAVMALGPSPKPRGERISFRRMLEEAGSPSRSKDVPQDVATTSQAEVPQEERDQPAVEKASLTLGEVLGALLAALLSGEPSAAVTTEEGKIPSRAEMLPILSGTRLNQLIQALPPEVRQDLWQLVRLVRFLEGEAPERLAQIPSLATLPSPEKGDLEELSQWLHEVVDLLKQEVLTAAAQERSEKDGAAGLPSKAGIPWRANLPNSPEGLKQLPVQERFEAQGHLLAVGSGEETQTSSGEEGHLAAMVMRGKAATVSPEEKVTLLLSGRAEWLKTVERALQPVQPRHSQGYPAFIPAGIKPPEPAVDLSLPEVVVPRLDRSQPEWLIRPVVQHASVMLQEGISEMRLQLIPESLGRIHLEVSVHDGVVNARVTVENERVRAILESNMAQLRDALQEQGLQLGGFSVACGHEQAGQWYWRQEALVGWSSPARGRVEEAYQLGGAVREEEPVGPRDPWREGLVDALV